MKSLSYFLIICGILILIVGIILLLIDSLDLKIFKKLGNLPGDIKIKGKNFVFYFPLTTSILISIILSLFIFLISIFLKNK
jgi:hypothetical protein